MCYAQDTPLPCYVQCTGILTDTKPSLERRRMWHYSMQGAMDCDDQCSAVCGATSYAPATRSNLNYSEYFHMRHASGWQCMKTRQCWQCWRGGDLHWSGCFISPRVSHKSPPAARAALAAPCSGPRNCICDKNSYVLLSIVLGLGRGTGIFLQYIYCNPGTVLWHGYIATVCNINILY